MNDATLKKSLQGTRIAATLQPAGVVSRYIRSSFGQYAFWVNMATGEALTSSQLEDRFALLCRRGGTITVTVE